MRTRTVIYLLIFLALFCTDDLYSQEAHRKAEESYIMKFPRDHGAHPDFQTEWWYYTGQLFSPGASFFADEPLYGFQLTFFRRAEFGAGGVRQQFYLAHAAITDIRKRRFLHEKRIGRPGLGLAGASERALHVWNRDWDIEEIGGQHILRFGLDDDTGKIEMRLRAVPAGSPVLQGKSGFSRKGDCDSCASHYYSFPALRLEGEISKGAESEKLAGLGWMDHEFMSNALQKHQAGWDWFSIMLADGRQLMLFKLRKIEGGLDYASGTLVSDDGQLELAKGDFEIQELSTWKSPESGAEYPASWRIKLPQEQIDLELAPRVAGQEIFDPASPNDTSYWEGAVSDRNARAIGYIEMTGYHKPLGGNF